MISEPFSICLDAGHGGSDPGAVGPKGLKEKAVALSVTMLLGALLIGAGVTVHYTRQDDTFIALEKRAEIANKLKADLFLSIHCNSGPPGSGDGFEVFTTRGRTASDPFATDLFLSDADGFPEKHKRVDTADGDPDKESDFAVLRHTDMAAALFELEFIHTEEGEAWLADKANHAKMAKALFAGIMKHRGIATVPAPAASPSNTQADQFAPIFAKICEITTRAAEATSLAIETMQASLKREAEHIDALRAEIQRLKKGDAGA